ncbi:MAG: beta-ketoacyl-ACP synthase II [Anaerolineales bacterium]
MRRVVVTGLGTVNPLGLSTKESWENCVNGVSGVGPITHFDASEWLVNIACEVKDFDPANYMRPPEVRRRDRFEQLATAAAQEALADSGLEITEENAPRVGSIVSSAIGGLGTIQNAAFILENTGPRRVSPFVIPMLMPNGASGLICIDTGAKGPALSVASACASGADGIGLAWRLIRGGEIDAAFAGASEATICQVGVASFDRLGAMSRRNDDYSMTPQPFDKHRDGLVMGEGAAILILEEYEHARARGAKIYAELAGYAATADAFHITAPHGEGAGGAAAMRQAIDSAGLNIEEVDYINAHGTATPLNDSSETRAIKTAFGKRAYDVPISSTKSMTGHMMGATGALEAIFCAEAIHNGVIPPTIHYETPDPECDLDYVPNEARDADVRVAISNAFGFGGHNAVLVLKKIA